MSSKPMFDDIRPYYDSEIPAAMQRIANSEHFALLSAYIFPDRSIEEVREEVRSIDNIGNFQRKIMYKANCRIIEQTISNFSYGGFENIDRAKRYLYVSNHRDIMLDASLLQNVLIDNGLDTTEITFGANLMQGELVIDVGKSNKMFRVERPSGNIRDFYLASKHLSEYIREAICERGESVWIAQRNGRTKDGVDRTDQGIINMFRMSSDDKIGSIADLNILPVAVSYEWEPCDVLKAVELFATSQGPYHKREGEDLNSILTGITQFKGNVHFEICRPITADELLPCAELLANDFNKHVASLIDQRICSSYRLMSNNYIAYDILSGSTEYSHCYTAEQRERFEEHLSVADNLDNGEEVKRILLGIYANPVESKKFK